MSTALLTRRYTSTEYLTLERIAAYKNEFSDGEILPMSGGTAIRSRIGVNIISGLDDALSETKCRVYNSDTRIRIQATERYTYPDATVVGASPEFEDAKHDTLLNPLLIIEVLSDSTEDDDRETRLEHYKTIASFREYVLIAQTEPRATVWQRQADDSWLPTETVGLDSYVSLVSVGCALPLARIYRKVSFS
jgi:Uma2 family endonuclease